MTSHPVAPAAPATSSPPGGAGLSVDAEGRFLHAGTPVTHPGLLAALWRGLFQGPDGGWWVRLGQEVAGVSVEGTPWRVRGVAVTGEPPDQVDLLLTDGSVEPLDPSTLWLGQDGVLRCSAKGGQPARFTRAGQLALGVLLEEAPPGSGRWRLTLGGAAFPLSAATEV